jgi:hypothetical protein
VEPQRRAVGLALAGGAADRLYVTPDHEIGTGAKVRGEPRAGARRDQPGREADSGARSNRLELGVNEPRRRACLN